jgi:hypothetical protein
MLTKALKTKHEQAAAQSFWWALWSKAQVDDDVAAAEQYRFAKCVCEKFAEYANVIDAGLFLPTSENALSNWAMAISHPKSHHPAFIEILRFIECDETQRACADS